MIFRSYTGSDDEAIKSMLNKEGIIEEDMAFGQYPTYILEDKDEPIGFITIKEEHGYPSLQHLCVRADRRMITPARLLIKMFRYIGRLWGGKKGIIHIKHDSARLKKLIEYYFKVKPYATENERYWYFVNL